MAKIDLAKASKRKGSGYPAPFHLKSPGRIKSALGDAKGLTDFGVNLVTLPPGEWSSQRHWHTNEDEFIYVISGELILITGAGETVMTQGECAAFPKGKADAHHMINRSDTPAVYLEVGTRTLTDECRYPDVDLDLRLIDGKQVYCRKDGTPYP